MSNPNENWFENSNAIINSSETCFNCNFKSNHTFKDCSSILCKCKDCIRNFFTLTPEDLPRWFNELGEIQEKYLSQRERLNTFDGITMKKGKSRGLRGGIQNCFYEATFYDHKLKQKIYLGTYDSALEAFQSRTGILQLLGDKRDKKSIKKATKLYMHMQVTKRYEEFVLTMENRHGKYSVSELRESLPNPTDNG